MTNPSRITMIHRLTGGNTANPYGAGLDPAPEYDERKVSAHEFIIVFQQWDFGIITKGQAIAEYNFTHANDSADLDAMIGWYQAATNKQAFLAELEGRFILAREKQDSTGTTDLNGTFGYAVKSTLINGADGAHSLENTGPIDEQFNSWT